MVLPVVGAKRFFVFFSGNCSFVLGGFVSDPFLDIIMCKIFCN